MRVHLSSVGSVDVLKRFTVFELAQKVFPKKSHLMVGAFINKNKEISDIRTLLNKNDSVDLVFLPSKESLEVIRHSAAHVMAQAVQELWPDIKVTIGPVIENGFYYDFDSARSFYPEDLQKIEKKMQEIIKRKLKVEKETWSKVEAIKLFKKMGEDYKVEIIEALNEPEVSIYKQGEWFDLCRGPHVGDLSQIGAVKVLSLAGSYWRGDESRAKLQRIYGTAFHTEKELKIHLNKLEEASKRDHRKLGKEMGLFYFSDLSTGSPFFTGAGSYIYNGLKQFLQKKYFKYNYEEVITPQVFHSKLFQQSGHRQHFSDNMYSVEKRSFGASDSSELFLKPMNCPGHCILYSFKRKSYRDLPWRVADFGRLHRREKRGVLHGLTRVNSMCQDDAHVFCTSEQLQPEIDNILSMFKEVYTQLGLTDYKIAFSTRPEDSMGEDIAWEQAEAELEKALKKSNLPYEIHEGEGAFYGPKLDLMFTDAIGRLWQLGTLQCDFNMPLAFDLKYVDSDNKEKTPILLHRAILGTLERFIGIYLEHTGGYLPLWLAPVQVLFINISKDQEKYILECAEEMRSLNIRVETDIRSEKLGYKIREARLRRISCMAVAGEREMESQSFSVRFRDGKSIQLKKADFIKGIVKTVETKELDNSKSFEGNKNIK